MTTVQMNLPDDLTQKAASAGLVSAKAIQALLREQLRRRAGPCLPLVAQLRTSRRSLGQATKPGNSEYSCPNFCLIR